MCRSVQMLHLSTKVSPVRYKCRILIYFILGCVVPSFLHRAHKRFTLLGDTYHHVELLRTVLQYRKQDMNVIDSKIKNFYNNRRKSRSDSVKRLVNTRRVVSIKYDSVSHMHLFTRRCILKSYKAAGVSSPKIVHSSLPKVMSKLYTKRSVLSQLRSTINI